MKALVKYAKGHGNMEIRDVDIPQIKNNEVLIKVKSAAICGTDLHIYEGNWPVVPPVIIGHEFSGEIVEVGNDTKNLHIGDRVVSETHGYYCDDCLFCRTGNPNLCHNRKGLGYILNGAFTEYISVRKEIIHRIPENISYKEAAVIEPLADTIHAVVVNSKISAGDTVAILGPGPVGLLALQLVKLKGATQVMVTGLSEDDTRLRSALNLGADYIINVQKEDPVKKILDITKDLGADMVLEASGSNNAIKQAFSLVRKGGHITLMGIPSQQAREFDLRSIILKEISVKGTFVNTWIDWELAIKLMSSGIVDVKPLITHTFKLEDWEEAFQLLHNKKGIKIVFLND